jgi:lipopolysaccharide biosynthesis glycosyltransferase
MLTPLVTAINAPYFPGLRALYKSYLVNAGPGFEFYCIVDGDADLFARVEALGVKAIKLPKWVDVYPTSIPWPVEMPAEFADLQIPQLFPDHEKAIWIDADCIIVDSLAGLLEYEFTEPVAACDPKHANYTLGFVLENCPPALAEIKCPFTGLIIFNVPEYNRLDIMAKCAAAMTDETIVYRYGDQSVLGYVLAGNWFGLPMLWQTFAHRKKVNLSNAKILHWLAAKPWADATPYRPGSKPQTNMQTQKIWDKYGL